MFSLNRASDFIGLNVTCHLLAHAWMVSMSCCNSKLQVSTICLERDVSSANSDGFAVRLCPMSLI